MRLSQWSARPLTPPPPAPSLRPLRRSPPAAGVLLWMTSLWPLSDCEPLAGPSIPPARPFSSVQRSPARYAISGTRLIAGSAGTAPWIAETASHLAPLPSDTRGSRILCCGSSFSAAPIMKCFPLDGPHNAPLLGSTLPNAQQSLFHCTTCSYGSRKPVKVLVNVSLSPSPAAAHGTALPALTHPSFFLPHMVSAFLPFLHLPTE